MYKINSSFPIEILVFMVLSYVDIWVQSWVQSSQIPAKTVYYDAAPG